MNRPALVIPADGEGAALHVQVNPLYSLYHYLAKRMPAEQRPTALAEAAMTTVIARFPIGAHGAWDEWELPVARAETLEAAVSGMKAAMRETAEQIGVALRQAERVYREEIWPERLPRIEAALTILRERLAPSFPAMVRAQAENLGLVFPPRIDAFLVADCYDRRGGYSHPLTLDVTLLHGLDLCETVIHEATHLAERHTRWTVEREGLGDRLRAYLAAHGMTSNQLHDVAHAVLFAASAAQVRSFIDSHHVDYALTHNAPDNTLYSWFKMPRLPEIWAAFAAGALAEPALFDALCRERFAAEPPARTGLA
ncbi:MAG TPA: hypothetical protein VFW96_05760 [Thermomicrobiales bacterium]|nr:hypothetical protein [Thermomicrobiales bacterium]